jgi:hypothetical protein
MKSTEFEDINKNGTKLPQRYAFIPRNLEIENRPELSNFSYNILFISYETDGKQTLAAEAIYVPVIETFRAEGQALILDYVNQYKPENRILIIFHQDTGQYEGEKFLDGKSVSTTIGSDWKNFFINLTAPGLSDGEGCKFSVVPRKE